jgi:hypothetical protein
MMPPPPPPTTAGSKRPASPAASRGVKKTKGKARGDNVYDDADAVLEDPKSPLYKDNLNLKVIHPFSTF